MTRPLREEVGHTTDLVWHLADRDPDSYESVARAVRMVR